MPTTCRTDHEFVESPGAMSRLQYLRREVERLSRMIEGMRCYPQGTGVWVEKNPNGIRLHVGGSGTLPETSATREALGVTPEGTETADVSTGYNSDGTWDWDDQDPAKGGVTIKLTTRVVYNEAGDQIVYGFHREFEWDTNGFLVHIGAETQYTVDVPVVGCC